MSDDHTTPYRPPAQDEQQLAEKVCPDCITDPDHHSEGGLRPVSEFRVITGKGAKGYTGGKRLAAYCRYHEAARSRAHRAQKRRAREEEGAPPAKPRPKRRMDFARTAKLRAARKRYSRQRIQRMRADPAYREHVRALAAARSQRWEAAHAEERRRYKAQWYQERVRQAVEAGEREEPKYRYKPGSRAGMGPRGPRRRNDEGTES